MTILMTMDTDWVSPETMEHVFTELIDPRLAVTSFSTGAYEVLTGRPNTEIALHYNADRHGIEQGFSDIAQQLPGVRGARGHSLAFSERLRPLYRQHGIRYDSSYMMFMEPNIPTFRIAREVWELPIYFMDLYFLDYFDGDFGQAPDRSDWAQPGLKVVDFHPIHLLLNTPSIEFYFSIKHLYHDTEELLKRRHRGRGVATLFLEMQEFALKRAQKTLSEVVEELDASSQSLLRRDAA